MDSKLSKYVCTMWASAIFLIAVRYLCAAVLTAGMLPDTATYQMALDSLGPFLPIMSTICLCGGLLFLLAELAVQLRNRKKK